MVAGSNPAIYPINKIDWITLLSFNKSLTKVEMRTITKNLTLTKNLVIFKKKKKQKHIFLLNQYFLLFFDIVSKNFMTFFSNRGQALYIYNYMCTLNNLNNFFFYSLSHDSREMCIVFDNKKQLRCNLLLNNKLLKSFTTGFLLNYTNTFKKELKKKKNTKILLVKFVSKLVDSIYSEYNIILKVLGTSKNFFKWLNFFKLSAKINKNYKKRQLYYIFQPSLNLGFKNQKKIKSIKRRLKKRYLYSNSI